MLNLRTIKSHMKGIQTILHEIQIVAYAILLENVRNVLLELYFSSA